MIAEGFTISNQVYVPERLKPDNIFEQHYIGLRQKEQRLYADEEVKRLPEVNKDHVHFDEWNIRKRSSERLFQYLLAKKTPVRILEAGCGNGWLSNRLAGIPGSKVIGADINFTELQQAARVFNQVPNLLFIYGNPESGILEKMEFDCIVFASCIQYFEDLHGIIRQTLRMLKPGGEIHILDSPFYRASEISSARQRTLAYYTSLGYGEMSRHYFHHDLNLLDEFQPEYLYSPTALARLLPGKRNPFPWIRIKQSALRV